MSDSRPSSDQAVWRHWLINLAGLALCLALAAAFIAAAYVLKRHHVSIWIVSAVTLGYCIAIFAVATVFSRMARKATGARQSEAAKLYLRRFLGVMGAYAIILLLVVDAFVRFKPTGPLAYGLAVAPAVPLVASIVIIGIYLRDEPDEFERAIQTEAALLSTGVTMALATVWGFLEQFHLAPAVPSWAVFPLWAFMLAPSQLIVRRRYR